MIIFLLFNVFVAFVVGFAFWLNSKNIVTWEWGLSSVIAVITGLVLYQLLLFAVCSDTQTLSGSVLSLRHQPYWVEETKTTKDGKTTTSHTTHYPTWYMTYTTGKNIEEMEIEDYVYNTVFIKFGSTKEAVLGHRPDFDYGDLYDYITHNTTNYFQPIVIPKIYINRLKGSTSLFSYSSSGSQYSAEKYVVEYPYVKGDFLVSKRLLGTAKVQFNQLDFDRMNARLGPMKKVNVILVGLASNDNTLGKKLEKHWQGGKKNDLIVCYGRNWAYCFGWTESDIVKRNLESLFLTSTINNTLLSNIESEIRKNYVLKDWNKFNYVDINFPLWAYFVSILINIIIQSMYFMFALNNRATK